MASSPVEATVPGVLGASIDDESPAVDLADGRTITVPLGWYPRLAHGTSAERANWGLIDGGHGIHWPELDEDIPVSALIAGKPSAERGASLQRWLDGRRK